MSKEKLQTHRLIFFTIDANYLRIIIKKYSQIQSETWKFRKHLLQPLRIPKFIYKIFLIQQTYKKRIYSTVQLPYNKLITVSKHSASISKSSKQ